MKYKINAARNSSTEAFIQKMTTIYERETTAGRSIYKKNEN
jgi:hypothetical protein